MKHILDNAEMIRTGSRKVFKPSRLLGLRSIKVSAGGPEFKPPFVPLVADGFSEAIGNTPLIRLPNISKSVGRNIYAKAEYMNPGGSIKDRAAKFILDDAERKGLIQPGGTVVEGTAGNTGIGLAHVCRLRGYNCVIYMPNTQSQAKIETLRLLGAEVHPVPAVAFDNPQNYNHQAKRHAELLENAVWTNQFDNVLAMDSSRESVTPSGLFQDLGLLEVVFLINKCSARTLPSAATTGLLPFSLNLAMYSDTFSPSLP